MRINDAPEGNTTDLEPTHFECFECEKIIPIEDADYSDDEFPLCPNDAEHATEFLHISDDPISGDEITDNDHYHHGLKQYAYRLAVKD